MPDAAPFLGIRYNTSIVDPAAVTAPPYDVITPAERTALEAASPYNVVRLILGPLGREEDKYIRARELLEQWLAEGVLRRDERPALTVYEETFDAGGVARRQRGVLAAVEISDEILPHERTMAPVVEDRLAVVRTARANLSPVFCVYWTAEATAATAMDSVVAGRPSMDFASPDGVGHRAWPVADQSFAEAVAKTLAGARVVIADGHHRFRTAQAYRDERRASDGAGPWDRMLLYLVDAERDAPALLPIHRLVSGVGTAGVLEALAPAFEIEPLLGADAGALAGEVQRRRPAARCYGILSGEGAWIVTLRDESSAREATRGEHSEAWRDLDVAVLHALVFERLLPRASVTFVHHPGEAAQAVRSGEASCAVLLAATPVDAVRAVAEAHDSMPSKSTFFVPKPLTGIVLRSLETV